jgi:hypothetical protein
MDWERPCAYWFLRRVKQAKPPAKPERIVVADDDEWIKKIQDGYTILM